MGKSPRLRFEIEELKPVVQRRLAPHCTSELFTFKLHVVHHQLEDLERFGIMLLTDAALF